MLEELRAEFLREAKDAPKLFRDLAKVEQYIAESYKMRVASIKIWRVTNSQARVILERFHRKLYVISRRNSGLKGRLANAIMQVFNPNSGCAFERKTESLHAHYVRCRKTPQHSVDNVDVEVLVSDKAQHRGISFF